MKKINLVLFLLFALAIAVPSNANATILFFDNFQSGFGNWTQSGVGTSGTRSDYPTWGDPAPSGRPVGFLRTTQGNYASVVHQNINATGYGDLVLSYYGRAYSYDDDDELTVAWARSGTNSFTDIDVVDGEHAWEFKSFNLSNLANNGLIDLRISSLSGDTIGISYGDLALFDDIKLTGNQLPNAAVPEPATMALFGMGTLGLARFRRKKA